MSPISREGNGKSCSTRTRATWSTFPRIRHSLRALQSTRGAYRSHLAQFSAWEPAARGAGARRLLPCRPCGDAQGRDPRLPNRDDLEAHEARGLPNPAERPVFTDIGCNGSYVDGPLASVFISAVNGWRPSVICPASWRGLGPLALMKSDDPRLPIKGASFGLLTHCGVSGGLRSSRRVVHHVFVALAKLLSLRSPFKCVAPD